MALAERIRKDLEIRGEGYYRQITPKEFAEVEELLSKSKAKFTFNSRTNTLRFVMPSLIHGFCCSWIADWVHKMKDRGDVEQFGIAVSGEVDLRNFEGEYAMSTKTPDGGLFVRDRIWPPIALETGYSETEDDLMEDAALLLKGSVGRIGMVIVIKVQPLGRDDTQIRGGFVEVYRYDRETGRRVKFGRRQTLYPPPPDHSRQQLKFTWDHVLRNKINEHVSDSEKPPPLCLDDLRPILDECVPRHQAFKRGEPLGNQDDDSEKD